MDQVSALDNYACPDNLTARISIHAYAVNPNWTQWLFDREMPTAAGAARMLDIGCGTGALWTSNQGRIDPAWSVTLADSSAGMLEASRRDLGDRAAYAIADVQSLPIADDTFDIVLANHMLYHVADRPRAFAEISRVLSPGGSVHCSTNARGHLAELAALAAGSTGTTITRCTEAFGLENGPSQLAPFFTDITVERFDTTLRVPSVEPVLAYIRSNEGHHEADDLIAARDAVDAEIRREGFFSITAHPGLISARKPSATTPPPDEVGVVMSSYPPK